MVKRVPLKYLRGAPKQVAGVYDNGGKSIDRYTVIYKNEHPKRGMCFIRGMSPTPQHPQGVGLYGEMYTSDRPNLGKVLHWADVPDKVKQCIQLDCNEES